MALLILGSSAYGVIIIKSAIPLMNASDMTAEEMMEYDVENSDHIISAAIIKDGKITYGTYGTSENKISLNDSIAKYLSLDEDIYYPTIARLLTHTAGYDSYYFERFTMDFNSRKSLT